MDIRTMVNEGFVSQYMTIDNFEDSSQLKPSADAAQWMGGGAATPLAGPDARRFHRRQDCFHTHTSRGGFLVSWLHDLSLRDLDEGQGIEATCIRFLHTWAQSPLQLLLKVDHRDVYLYEVTKNLACPRSARRHVCVRLSLIRTDDTSGFVGGMP